jgi:hypothetical protein
MAKKRAIKKPTKRVTASDPKGTAAGILRAAAEQDRSGKGPVQRPQLGQPVSANRRRVSKGR